MLRRMDDWRRICESWDLRHPEASLDMSWAVLGPKMVKMVPKWVAQWYALPLFAVLASCQNWPGTERVPLLGLDFLGHLVRKRQRQSSCKEGFVGAY